MSYSQQPETTTSSSLSNFDLEGDFFNDKFIKEFQQNMNKFKSGIVRCNSQIQDVKKTLKISKDLQISKGNDVSQPKEIVIHIKPETE